MNQPTPPEPTEKAQIAVVLTTPQPPPVFRFNSLKKAEKEYKALKAAWIKQRTWDGGNKVPARMHDVDGDMFISTIDLTQIACMSFVDIAKRTKFIPYQG